MAGLVREERWKTAHLAHLSVVDADDLSLLGAAKAESWNVMHDPENDLESSAHLARRPRSSAE